MNKVGMIYSLLQRNAVTQTAVRQKKAVSVYTNRRVRIRIKGVYQSFLDVKKIVCSGKQNVTIITIVQSLKDKGIRLIKKARLFETDRKRHSLNFIGYNLFSFVFSVFVIKFFPELTEGCHA